MAGEKGHIPAAATSVSDHYLGSGLRPPPANGPLSSRPHQFVWLSGGSTYERRLLLIRKSQHGIVINRAILQSSDLFSFRGLTCLK